MCARPLAFSGATEQSSPAVRLRNRAPRGGLAPAMRDFLRLPEEVSAPGPALAGHANRKTGVTLSLSPSVRHSATTRYFTPLQQRLSRGVA